MSYKKVTETDVKQLKTAPVRTILRDGEVVGFFAEKKARSIVFYYRYRIDGRRSTFRIGEYGSLSVAEARTIAKKKAGQVANGRDIAKIRVTNRATAAERGRKNGATLKRFLEQEYKELTAAHTVADNLPKIKKHFKFLLPVRLDRIETVALDRWKLKCACQPATVNRLLATLQGVLTKAIACGYIKENPVKAVKRLSVDKNRKPRAIARNEQTALFEAIDWRQSIQQEAGDIEAIRQRRRFKKKITPASGPYSDYFKPLVIVAIHTGLRKGELFNLKWKDVNFDLREITVQGTGEKKTKDRTKTTGTKSSQSRLVPLNKTAYETLKVWQKHGKPKSAFVFPDYDGHRLTSCRYDWDSVKERAELNGVCFHNLRHTFGTRLARKNVDVITIKELMGHSSIEVTLLYLSTDEATKSKAVTELDE